MGGSRLREEEAQQVAASDAGIIKRAIQLLFRAEARFRFVPRIFNVTPGKLTKHCASLPGGGAMSVHWEGQSCVDCLQGRDPITYARSMSVALDTRKTDKGRSIMDISVTSTLFNWWSNRRHVAVAAALVLLTGCGHSADRPLEAMRDAETAAQRASSALQTTSQSEAKPSGRAAPSTNVADKR